MGRGSLAARLLPVNLAARDLTHAERRTVPSGSPTGEICPP
jgi:hypothetical protein